MAGTDWACAVCFCEEKDARAARAVKRASFAKGFVCFIRASNLIPLEYVSVVR